MGEKFSFKAESRAELHNNLDEEMTRVLPFLDPMAEDSRGHVKGEHTVEFSDFVEPVSLTYPFPRPHCKSGLVIAKILKPETWKEGG